MTLVQQEPKKIYIRVDEQGWHPGANTVAYYPLNGDLNDYSTYQRQMIILGTPVYTSILNGGTKQCANFISTDKYTSNFFTYTTDLTDIPTSGDMTLSYWFNWSGQYAADFQSLVAYRGNENYYRWMGLISNNKYVGIHGASAYLTTTIPTVGTWYYYTVTIDNGNYTIYINGVSAKTGSFSYGSAANDFCLGGFYSSRGGNSREECYNGKLSEVIVENKARTAQEVSDYYDQTKSLYGIS